MTGPNDRSTQTEMSATAAPSLGAGPARRRGWLLPVTVLVVWFVALIPIFGLAGNLSSVQSDGVIAALPDAAESAQVEAALAAVRQEESIPALVVWEVPDGVTAEQTAAIQAVLDDASALAGVDGPVVGPLVSADGLAVEAVVPVSAALGDGIADVVTELRTLVPVAGTTVYVTGPAGLISDFNSAFGGPDFSLIAAFVVVLIILLVVYRSPILPLLVLTTAGVALLSAEAFVYLLAREGWVTVDGASVGISSILVIGAATDYGLLLVARYREELRRTRSQLEAMRIAWRRSFEPIVASGAVVMAGVLCLLFSDLPSNKSLAPVLASSIGFSVIAALTLLPAALMLLGRSAFWPARPTYGSAVPEVSGFWGRVSGLVGRRPVAVAVSTIALLVAAAAFVPTLKAGGVSDTDQILGVSEAEQGQAVLERHFPGGDGTPARVLVEPARVPAVISAAEAVPGVVSAASADLGPVADGRVEVVVVLDAAPDSDEAIETVSTLRTAVRTADPTAQVGGYTASRLDARTTAERDRAVIIPIVLLVVTLLLALLLRALVAPIVLLATVVLSFAATLGISAVAFNHIFGFPGADPGVPLFAFVFLVALGIDYNIFLMTRVREESLRAGTRAGVLTGLAVTGGVITSAGLVLAGTFGALALFPVLLLAQIAFIVGVGVLVDTLVVRSLTLPALVYLLGDRVWWPAHVTTPPAVRPSGSRVVEADVSPVL